MGITDLSLKRINKYLKPNDNLLIIGCQNCYWPENYGEIAAQYFKSLGHKVKDIDIYECNGAQIADLREDLKWQSDFDLVLQHGTVEHVDGSLYQPFKNIHEACKVGGVMIHENPEIKSWPGHGYHYFTTKFYTQFCKEMGYEQLEVTREAAMGNFKDGWNVSSVLRKVSDKPFITEDQFNETYEKFIFAK
jgi:hypothetical protein